MLGHLHDSRHIDEHTELALIAMGQINSLRTDDGKFDPVWDDRDLRGY